MGVAEELRFQGSTQNTSGGTEGEQDGSYHQIRTRQVNEGPTLILLVGWSQSMAILRQAMRLWFKVSRYQMRHYRQDPGCNQLYHYSTITAGTILRPRSLGLVIDQLHAHPPATR